MEAFRRLRWTLSEAGGRGESPHEGRRKRKESENRRRFFVNDTTGNRITDVSERNSQKVESTEKCTKRILGNIHPLYIGGTSFSSKFFTLFRTSPPSSFPILHPKRRFLHRAVPDCKKKFFSANFTHRG